MLINVANIINPVIPVEMVGEETEQSMTAILPQALGFNPSDYLL